MPENKTIPAQPVYENLDTAYVNLAALLRYLRERAWTGRIHVELEEYEADLLLDGQHAPRILERNYATGAEAEGEAALRRVLVRASEPGGLISVYEDAATASSMLMGAAAAGGAEKTGRVIDIAARRTHTTAAQPISPEDAERSELLEVTGELIAAVERAVLVAGSDFAPVFHTARLNIADDYTFLDPLAARFEYADGRVQLRVAISPPLVVAGVSELLRRVVEYVARAEHRIGVRKDVAREFATLARRRASSLARLKYTPHLERIAGMKLL